MKKLLFGGISVVAVAGIGTGIGIAVSNSRVENASMENDGSKPGDGDKKPGTMPQPTMVDLKKLVEEIKAENIVFKKKQTTLPAVVSMPKNGLTTTKETDGRENVYAFDVTATELDFDAKTKKKLEEYKVEVKIELNNTNNGVLLNNGKLDINLKASFKEKTDKQQEETKALQLEGFKQTTEALKTWITKQENTSVLDLTTAKKPDTTTIPSVTIESLNATMPVAEKAGRVAGRNAAGAVLTKPEKQNEAPMVSGLTALFQTVKKGDAEDEVKTISIQGKVKLEKLTKEGMSDTEKTVFHLVSADNNPLKLIETKDGSQSVALLNEIKVTSLLVSNIKLVPYGLDDETQAKYVEKFNKEASTKHYMGSAEKGFHVEVMKTQPDPGTKVDVKVNPFYVNRTQEKQPILVNLEISFGTEEGLVKTYKTTEKTDLDELTAAGFEFGFYSKKVGDKEEIVEATKITEVGNMLEVYFVKDGKTTPVKKSDIQMSDSGSPVTYKGGFSLVGSGTKEDNGYKIGEVTKTEQADDGTHRGADMQQVNWINENWISFVGYSYKGMKDKDSVLFIPTINLIHVEETKPTALPGAGI